ncbi:MAG: hypothetical protein M3O74_05610 [Pseudomonadota bacterium]|nr:hypothetical protein [Pseudomonadota bacterium]
MNPLSQESRKNARQYDPESDHRLTPQHFLMPVKPESARFAAISWISV